jgi:hypothetical protein
MRRPSFLPAFFTLLIATFAFAVVWKVRTYSKTETRINSSESPSSLSGAPAAAPAQGFDPAAGEPVNDTAETVSSNPATTSRVSAEREARYRELLNSPPPVSKGGSALSGAHASRTTPAAPVAKESPSLFSRIVSPIVNAIKGNGPAAQRPTSPPQTAQNKPSESSDRTTEKRDPKDPNSDVTAPQLLGVDFAPPTVHDGEEVLLAVTATDDLSGVRTISGNIISPGGALQGFALQHEGEGSNRYFSKILVPKDAAEGRWHVNYLNITDNASNSVTLSWQQGSIPQTAAFTVTSSRSDTTPPSLKAIWLDRPTMKTGDKNLIFVQADDDKSGVNLVSGVFLSPGKAARFGFGCRNQNGNVWECDLTPPANADCGDWQLEQVQLQDKANNMIPIRADNPIVAAVKVNITSDQCDSKPPVVQSISLDAAAISAPGVVNVTAVVTDDSSGVSSVSGHFVYTGTVAPGTQPPRLYFSCRPSGDASTNMWSGPVAVTEPKMPKGVWRMGSLQVIDKANNIKLYVQNDPVIANVSFRIQ